MSENTYVEMQLELDNESKPCKISGPRQWNGWHFKQSYN